MLKNIARLNLREVDQALNLMALNIRNLTPAAQADAYITTIALIQHGNRLRSAMIRTSY